MTEEQIKQGLIDLENKVRTYHKQLEEIQKESDKNKQQANKLEEKGRQLLEKNESLMKFIIQKGLLQEYRQSNIKRL